MTYPPHLGHDVIWLHKNWLDEDKFELSSKTKSELSDPVHSRTYLFQERLFGNTPNKLGMYRVTLQANTALMSVPQCKVECSAMIKEQWLSDIHTVSSPTEPFMVFTNVAEIRHGRRTIDGLCFNPQINVLVCRNCCIAL